MTDPRLQRLREHSAPPLSDGDVDRLMARAARRRTVRRVRRAAFAAVSCLLLAGAIGWRYHAQDHALRFADGSTADLIDAQSELSVSNSSASNMVVQVRRGGGRFDVARNPARVFSVVAGGVTIEVIGTRFVVERGATDVNVRVERGRVRVRTGQGVAELAAGESRAFAAAVVETTPPEPAGAPPAAAEDDEPSTVVPHAPPHGARHGAATGARAQWRDSAERRDYGKAYEQLSAQGMHTVRDVPDELLQAADVARLSGHPRDAVPLLQRAIKDHGRDPRAQLAAFTLGRVLLEELKQPQRAAEAFARARALAPRGPLAEDALFREAQSYARDGETRQAVERAKLYLKLYPDGSHRRAIERLGGLE